MVKKTSMIVINRNNQKLCVVIADRPLGQQERSVWKFQNVSDVHVMWRDRLASYKLAKAVCAWGASDTSGFSYYHMYVLHILLLRTLTTVTSTSKCGILTQRGLTVVSVAFSSNSTLSPTPFSADMRPPSKYPNILPVNYPNNHASFVPVVKFFSARWL